MRIGRRRRAERRRGELGGWMDRCKKEVKRIIQEFVISRHLTQIYQSLWVLLDRVIHSPRPPQIWPIIIISCEYPQLCWVNVKSQTTKVTSFFRSCEDAGMKNLHHFSFKERLMQRAINWPQHSHTSPRRAFDLWINTPKTFQYPTWPVLHTVNDGVGLVGILPLPTCAMSSTLLHQRSREWKLCGTLEWWKHTDA